MHIQNHEIRISHLFVRHVQTYKFIKINVILIFTTEKNTTKKHFTFKNFNLNINFCFLPQECILCLTPGSHVCLKI